MSLQSDWINSFILEDASELSNNNIDKYSKIYNKFNDSVFDKTMNMINPSLYNKYIDSAIDNLNQTQSESTDLDKFYSSVYKSKYLDDRNLVIHVQNKDYVEKIRPEYFNNLVIEYKDIINKIISGKKNVTDVKSKYVSGEYFEKLKKQLVKRA